MGAYIGGIYEEEVKGRPRYIVDEEIVNEESTHFEVRISGVSENQGKITNAFKLI